MSGASLNRLWGSATIKRVHRIFRTLEDVQNLFFFLRVFDCHEKQFCIYSQCFRVKNGHFSSGTILTEFDNFKFSTLNGHNSLNISRSALKLIFLESAFNFALESAFFARLQVYSVYRCERKRYAFSLTQD